MQFPEIFAKSFLTCWCRALLVEASNIINLFYEMIHLCGLVKDGAMGGGGGMGICPA